MDAKKEFWKSMLEKYEERNYQLRKKKYDLKQHLEVSQWPQNLMNNSQSQVCSIPQPEKQQSERKTPVDAEKCTCEQYEDTSANGDIITEQLPQKESEENIEESQPTTETIEDSQQESSKSIEELQKSACSIKSGEKSTCSIKSDQKSARSIKSGEKSACSIKSDKKSASSIKSEEKSSQKSTSSVKSAKENEKKSTTSIKSGSLSRKSSARSSKSATEELPVVAATKSSENQMESHSDSDIIKIETEVSVTAPATATVEVEESTIISLKSPPATSSSTSSCKSVPSKRSIESKKSVPSAKCICVASLQCVPSTKYVPSAESVSSARSAASVSCSECNCSEGSVTAARSAASVSCSECNCSDDALVSIPSASYSECKCSEDEQKPETISLFSIASNDLEYLKKLISLKEHEKKLKTEIDMLAQDVNKPAMGIMGTTNNQGIVKEVKDLRKKIRDCVDRIQGPMAHQLECEKFKSKQIEKQLIEINEAIEESQKAFHNEMNQLKMQLLCTCNSCTMPK